MTQTALIPSRPAAVREACTALVPEALARRVDLGFEGEGPAPIRGQPLLVRELIANLVDNALRYAPRGSITVRVAVAGRAGASLAVEDDGPGIPPEIVRRHGGTVSLSDGPGGKGLRVEVRFPAADPEVRALS